MNDRCELCRETEVCSKCRGIPVLEAGNYYVGDLCYVLGDKNGFDWSDVLKSTNCLGLELEPWCETRYFTYKNTKFFSSPTMYGDGEYRDQDSRTYGVDGGCIGCFPMSKLPEDVDTSGGQVVNFADAFKCDECDELNGIIRIGHLHINTGSSVVDGEDTNEQVCS